MIVDLFVDTVMGLKDIFTISPYSMLYIVPLIAPVLIATVNYGKLMNIGVKKKDIFFGMRVKLRYFRADYKYCRHTGVLFC